MSKAKAEKELDRANRNLAKWEAKLEEHRLKLRRLESNLGAEALESDDPSVGRKLTEQRDNVAACESAVVSARVAVEKAERSVQAAQADELEERAAELRAQANEHQRRTDELLTQIEEHEGVKPRLVWEPTSDEIRAAGAGGIVYKTPTTQRLRREATQLLAQASSIRERLNAISQQEQLEQAEKAYRDWIAFENERFRQQRIGDEQQRLLSLAKRNRKRGFDEEARQLEQQAAEVARPLGNVVQT